MRSRASRLASGSSSSSRSPGLHDGTADRHALLLAAGEGARQAVEQMLDPAAAAATARTRCVDLGRRQVRAARSGKAMLPEPVMRGKERDVLEQQARRLASRGCSVCDRPAAQRTMVPGVGPVAAPRRS